MAYITNYSIISARERNSANYALSSAFTPVIADFKNSNPSNYFSFSSSVLSGSSKILFACTLTPPTRLKLKKFDKKSNDILNF